MSYKIDHQAFRVLAEREFGLIGPVTVERTRHITSKDNAQAVCWLRHPSFDDADYLHHVIRLQSGVSREQAGRSLAHELQHCADTERILRTTTDEDPMPALQRWAAPPGVPYRRRPCEVKAHAAGEWYGPMVVRECIR